MVNTPSINNQPNKQIPSIRSFTPSSVAMPAQKPIQAINPQIPSAYRNGFTPSSIQVPVSQPTAAPKPQQNGAKND